MTKLGVGVAGLLLALAMASAAAAKPLWRTPWAAAERTYSYQATESDPKEATPGSGQRVAYRLTADARGGLVAHIITAEALDHGAWRPLALADDCKAALHAGSGEVAQVLLRPLPPEAASLGPAFMAACAPDDLFNPMTDILNVALVIADPKFGALQLTRPGQTAHFPGLTAHVDRGAFTMTETSDTGDVTLVSLDRREAVLDWKPSPSKLQMIRGTGAAAMTMAGGEHFAFRITVDRRTGLLVRAAALYDDVEMTIALPGLPEGQRPHVHVRRVVTIEPAT